MGSNEMTDAEYLRWIAGVIRDGFDGVALVSPNRLTALADRLDGGVIVPREPTEAMLTAIREAHWESSGCQFCAEDYRAAYRALLTASEAK